MWISRSVQNPFVPIHHDFFHRRLFSSFFFIRELWSSQRRHHGGGNDCGGDGRATLSRRALVKINKFVESCKQTEVKRAHTHIHDTNKIKANRIESMRSDIDRQGVRRRDACRKANTKGTIKTHVIRQQQQQQQSLPRAVNELRDWAIHIGAVRFIDSSLSLNLINCTFAKCQRATHGSTRAWVHYYCVLWLAQDFRIQIFVITRDQIVKWCVLLRPILMLSNS